MLEGVPHGKTLGFLYQLQSQDDRILDQSDKETKIMKHQVNAQVNFSCNQCGSSNLRLVGGVKTTDDKTFLVCQCECGASVPLNIESIQIKLFEVSPSKTIN